MVKSAEPGYDLRVSFHTSPACAALPIPLFRPHGRGLLPVPVLPRQPSSGSYVYLSAKHVMKSYNYAYRDEGEELMLSQPWLFFPSFELISPGKGG